RQGSVRGSRSPPGSTLRSLRPEAVKAAALRRRHVAHPGPAGGQGQRAKAPATAAGPAEDPAGYFGKRVIERRPTRHPCPRRKAAAVDRRAQLFGILALTPMAHHFRQWDLDRANAL